MTGLTQEQRTERADFIKGLDSLYKDVFKGKALDEKGYYPKKEEALLLALKDFAEEKKLHTKRDNGGLLVQIVKDELARNQLPKLSLDDPAYQEERQKRLQDRLDLKSKRMEIFDPSKRNSLVLDDRRMSVLQAYLDIHGRTLQENESNDIVNKSMKKWERNLEESNANFNKVYKQANKIVDGIEQKLLPAIMDQLQNGTPESIAAEIKKAVSAFAGNAAVGKLSAEKLFDILKEVVVARCKEIAPEKQQALEGELSKQPDTIIEKGSNNIVSSLLSVLPKVKLA